MTTKPRWKKYDQNDRSTWPSEDAYGIYLVWMGGYYEICMFNFGDGTWFNREDCKDHTNVSHYMMLPDAPEGELQWNRKHQPED